LQFENITGPMTGPVKTYVVRISVSIDKKYRIQSESMRYIAAWNLSSIRLWMMTDVFTGSISRAQCSTVTEYYELL